MNKLTLIMPTYNRQSFALRSMRYWSERDAILHVIDGSAESISTTDLCGLASNVHYHHMPVSLCERLYFSASLVTTKYCSMLEDDSFFLPSALAACINELEENSHLSACSGLCAAFKTENGEVVGEIQFSEFKDHSIESDNAMERVDFHLKNFTPTLSYAVMKTSVWKLAIRTLGDDVYLSARMGELPFEIIASHSGPSRVLPILYWLRSIENPSIPLGENTLPLSHWWRNTKCIVDRARILLALTSILRITISINSTQLDDAITHYCEHIDSIEKKNKIKAKLFLFYYLKDILFGVKKLKPFIQIINSFTFLNKIEILEIINLIKKYASTP